LADLIARIQENVAKSQQLRSEADAKAAQITPERAAELRKGAKQVIAERKATKKKRPIREDISHV
jgi:hypothetical protein